MSTGKLPENFEEHGKEFNRISDADIRKLNTRDEREYRMIEAQKAAFKEQTEADNERHREKRIEKEIDRLLRKPAPGMNGPSPVLGGRRVDQPDGVARQNLTPEQIKNLRETAAENVRKADEAHLQKIERAYTQAQRDLLDRALGPNRYPSQKR